MLLMEGKTRGNMESSLKMKRWSRICLVKMNFLSEKQHLKSGGMIPEKSLSRTFQIRSVPIKYVLNIQ